MIAAKMGADVYAARDGLPAISSYDLVLLGSSTWGWGELQDEWEEAIDQLKDTDLSGRKVGVFGSGDQMGCRYLL